MSVGTKGSIEVFEHFMGYDYTAGATMSGAVTAGVTRQLGHLIAVASASGAITQTTDEPGGLLKVTLDTSDDTNCGISTACPFKPADGGMWMETRFKVDAVDDLAIYAGFQETRSVTTPVMAAEFATESFAYGAAGGFAGMQFDADGTTDDWRAVGGKDAVPAWDADSLATAANQPAVADKFDVVRVEVNSHGDVDIYFSGSLSGGMRLVKHKDAVVDATDVFFPILLVENRATAAAAVMEVDYFNCGGFIDWTQ
jgi:hypothetical protein